MPIGGLYATYHLLREPGNSIETSLFSGGDLFSRLPGVRFLVVDPHLSLGRSIFSPGQVGHPCSFPGDASISQFSFLARIKAPEMEIRCLGRSMEMEIPIGSGRK